MTNLAKKILMVEDEPSLAIVLCEYLAQAGFQTHIIDNGLEVIDWVKQESPDLLILDLMLPNRDGLDIYRELRTFSQVPVVMATARVDEIDRLLGLELGADDYICKPYSPREVVARIKNVLRRTVEAAAPQQNGLVINDKQMKVAFNEQELTLTPAEFRLLSFFNQHPGQVFNRDQIMQKIYADNRLVTDRTIDSHIKNLRKKLQDANPDGEYIKSIYGVGYKFTL
ncbi:response regulator [Moritella viscosa]|uniref:Phosphate regulon transcriptional regulatory protein PhoB n=1 Tax=Moritella viscosa TaxID=80854 RepID=A0A090KB87_9GAMM|nr:response regulator [Moritella viscosa]CED61118.1 response regulator [Moritella viscosa]SGY86225.1 DNA-binding response regulator BaeS [Moritella viscosa]SGY86711.1 DNA-binding response regulator BaeS [Moritella viscosa]SGY87814.1 DNA-binding response regulator BaeS [Moritella viscosa]SGY87888.1 DNA-binding response regulator BaeS [Moritella viscosa]